MPSVAVPTAAPTVAVPASSGSSASGASTRTRDRDMVRDSRADFQTEVDSALRDDASPTSVASERSTSGRDTTQDSSETGRAETGRNDTERSETGRADERRGPRDAAGEAGRGGRGEPAVDRDTMAAIIAAGEAGGAPAAAAPDAAAATGEATSYESLLAQLGLKLDANGQVVLAGGDAATDGTETTTDGAATDLAAALAALAQLLGQQPAQPTTMTAPQAGAAATGAVAAGATPTPPVTVPTGDGAAVPTDLAAATDPAAQAAVAASGETVTGQAAVDTTARPTTRAGLAATKAEERLRRISAEVAKLDGGAANSALAGVEVKGTITPVTGIGGDAVATVPAATLGELLAIAERGAGADPLPQAPAKTGEATTPFVLPTTTMTTDPAAGTVATASTPATIPSSQATLDTLAQTVAAHAARQDSRFEIKLNPHELGKVDVTMHISSDGTVTAHLRVERPETLDMMLRDQSHLQRALEQSGLNVGSGGLEFSLQQQGQGWDRDAAETVREVAEDEVEDGAPVEAVAAARRYSRAGPAGIDLRI